MNKGLNFAACASIALTVGSTGTAIAFEPGDWLIRAGATVVDPVSDNHETVSVDSATSATFNFSYMMTDVWSVEVLAAYPFKHDIALLDGTDVGSTKHLPPTVSLQYHFMPTSRLQPYLGIGINYTDFFSEKTYGPLEGTDLKLGSSWGWAAQIGFDVMVSDNWFLNLDLRYIDIESKAKLDNQSIGKVVIDPWVYGANIGFRF